MKDLVYWTGHRCFGDIFCLCAAAELKSLESKTKIKVTFWSKYKEFITYFNNIEYVEEDWVHENPDIRVDCGIDPGSETYQYNGVTRCLRFMTTDKEILSCSKIILNIRPYLNNKTISICANGNVNGGLSVDVLKKMLERSKHFYPDHKIQFIGYAGPSLSLYDGLISEYNIQDNRTNDPTIHTIMQQLRLSSLVIGVHTGPIFAALALDVPVWCENSKNLQHNYLLDFPSNKPFFFV
jgi:hypothetical protein